jgi:hypothetical protein
VISLGTIQPASQITDPVIQACANDISQLSSNLDHTMAVPIAIRIQLTSTLSSAIVVNLVNQYLAVKGDAPEPASNEEPFLLAEGYAAGPGCAIPDAINGRIQWQNAAPGVPQTWHGYILEPNAITPNDPTGAASAIHRLLLDPMVTLGASLAKVSYLPASSPFEMLCQYPDGRRRRTPAAGGRSLMGAELWMFPGITEVAADPLCILTLRVPISGLRPAQQSKPSHGGRHNISFRRCRLCMTNDRINERLEH